MIVDLYLPNLRSLRYLVWLTHKRQVCWCTCQYTAHPFIKNVDHVLCMKATWGNRPRVKSQACLAMKLRQISFHFISSFVKYEYCNMVALRMKKISVCNASFSIGLHKLLQKQCFLNYTCKLFRIFI